MALAFRPRLPLWPIYGLFSKKFPSVLQGFYLLSQDLINAFIIKKHIGLLFYSFLHAATSTGNYSAGRDFTQGKDVFLLVEAISVLRVTLTVITFSGMNFALLINIYNLLFRHL